MQKKLTVFFRYAACAFIISLGVLASACEDANIMEISVDDFKYTMRLEYWRETYEEGEEFDILEDFRVYLLRNDSKVFNVLSSDCSVFVGNERVSLDEPYEVISAANVRIQYKEYFLTYKIKLSSGGSDTESGGGGGGSSNGGIEFQWGD